MDYENEEEVEGEIALEDTPAFVAKFIAELTPSQIQTLVSEIFRIQLCRNDDHNLAQSTVLKGLSSKDKSQQI
mgnify:CR=1 FL=1